jgi:hypothetical protein
MSPLVEMPRRRAELELADHARAKSTEERTVATGNVGDDVVVLLLVDLSPGWAWWGFSRLVFGTTSLRRIPGLRFAKVLGSGRDGGFGLQPSATRQGLFVVFDGEAAADDFLAASPTLQGYRRRAREACVLKLRAYSCRGSWGGQTIRLSADAPTSGPIVALTRASIRPLKARQFWPLAPPAQRSLESAVGCTLAAGLGEAPLLRQATISVWDSVGAMDAYARQGAHQQAIRNSVQGRYFSESMFVRFVPLSIEGTWKGRRLD